MLTTLLELSLQIMDFARGSRRGTMADAVKLTEANRNTLKQHFRNLAAPEHLQQQGTELGFGMGWGEAGSSGADEIHFARSLDSIGS